ncbi:prolyl 3-hydroxylase 1-like isoform X2 [Mizuhopecten yessoensis]|uniref:prolyl 3-hydroxylase 1-like isoform X2 n=1 Tax=Mizuhopecten yessoensis TaxID=6573 RepID=UPI000B458BD1|nr:prolyl 3-hydroxylase 1-like isoform X2 [Mizuhopecten yessoensis]
MDTCHPPSSRRRFHWFIFLLSWYCCVGLLSASPRSPVLTFGRLYTAGIQAIRDRKWHKCILFMKMAIEDHRFYKESIIDCRLKCKQEVHKHTGDSSFTVLDFQDVYLQLALTERACVQICRNVVFEERPITRISEEYWHDFNIGKPYNYLHFCYYKVDRMADATSAAYTFFLKNPDHQDTIDNIQSYRKEFGVKDNEIVDMERKQYKVYRGEGEKAYHAGDWDGVIEYFERALQEYYLEDERCRADCEGQYEHERDPDFIHAVADHYISVLQCQVGCVDVLSKIYVQQQPNYFAEHFHYLQYAYYKKQYNDRAVEATGTYLLFIPDNEDMQANRRYYIQNLGYHEAHFTPRKEALQYYKRQQMMEKMLEFVNVKYFTEMYDDEDDDIDMEKGDDQMAEEDLMNEVEKNKKNDPKLDGQEFYMKIFEKIGMKILAGKEDLKGSRFLAKGFTREGQCIELMYMISSIDPDQNGIRQISVVEALELVKKDSDYEMALRTLLKTTELTRHFTGRFFNKTEYFIKDVKLVCRDPVENSADQGPCVPQESGQCVGDTEVSEGYTDNDYISVAYLTDNDDSGIYFFDRWMRKQSSSLPGIKCGHLVGFEAFDRHGILPSKSQRCAMVVTYTSDRSHDNPVVRIAKSFLLSLENQRSASNSSVILQKFEREGTTVVQANAELHGNERVIADGLIDDEACSALIALAKNGAIIGDGYNEKDNFEAVAISPHTDNEIFEGLTIHRAIKLAKSGAVSKESVELYLSASERSRLFVEKFFNLTKPLYFDYTHLVCRTAVEGVQAGRTDLSHPVHGDNCQLNIKDGTCSRAFPAFVQRDYSALMYLNDDFEGGDFFFAHSNTSADVTLKPKCGRIIGFNAAHLHGVNSVTKGQRCAVAMWYTLDPNFKELARIQAQKVLSSMSSENSQDSDAEGSVHEEL